MARGVGYESLAALVDYLTKEEEDRQVSLSALADAARQGIGQGVVDPVVDFVGADRAAKIGQMAQATPAGISAMVSEDVPALLDMAGSVAGSSTQRQAAGRETGAKVRGAISGLADLVAKEGPMEVATRGLRAAGEGINQQIDERGFAAFTGPEDLVPGSKILAALGMAVPAMRMGKTAAKAKAGKTAGNNLFDVVNYPENRVHESYGLRVITRLKNQFNDDYLIEKFGKIPEEKPVRVGDKLSNSYEWADGDITDIELEGTSVLSIDPNNKDSIDKALRQLKKYVIGDEQIALVGGRDKGYGNDLGEGIIKDGIVLHTFNLDKLAQGVDPKKPLLAAPEPPRRSLLARLAEGVEDPGALERGRLEGRVGDKYDANLDELQQIRDKLYGVDDPTSLPDFQELRRREAVLTNETDPLNDPRGRKAEVRSLDALDPVEKARLDRAVEQGWDIDAFHGTKGDIEAFDPGLLGETTGAPSARMGYFFAADPETAQTYARTSKLEDVRPSITNREQELIDKVYELEAAGDWEGAAKATEAAEAFSLSLTNQTGQNIIPVKLRLQNPLEHDFKGEGYRDVSYQTLLENAKNKGHDGAIFRNTRDGGGVTDIYVVFEPAQIRSRYAAFDPKDTPKTGLRQNAKLANEALQVNRKQLEVLVKSKKAVEREYSDLWAVSDIFNKKAELALAEKKSPALREDMLELSNNIKALQDRMDLLEDEARKVTIGTGDITASFAPLVLPLGGGTAAAAYLANQEQE